jgi:2-hydroxy-6-oxonona-2,4-dienedioate hydrolase
MRSRSGGVTVVDMLLRQRDTAATRFERAEQRVFDSSGIAVTTRSVQLREPALRVRVLECGEGRPLLFVGGDSAVAAAWAPLVAKLPDRRAILLDRPGFGLGDGFDYRHADLRRHGVALLGSLLDALGLESVTIVGSSGGGQWGMWLAVDAPQRVHALVPMGIPAVCLPGMRPTAGIRMLSLPGLGRLSFAVPLPSAAATGRMLADADAHLPEHPEIVAAYHAARRLPGYGAAAAATFRRSLQVGGRARRTMVLTDEEQTRISQPVLFVWGEREPLGSPEIAHRAAALMPHARVEVVRDAWHHPWLADPAHVAHLLSTFLDDSSVATPLRALTPPSTIADVQRLAPTATAAIELRVGAHAPEGVLIAADARSRPLPAGSSSPPRLRTGALPGAGRAEVTNALSGPMEQRERRER